MVRPASRSEIGRWAMSLPQSIIIGTLLAGDRLSCCDEGVVWDEDGKIIGAATIAPNGEMMSGEPTIVALYVISSRRREGIGCELMKAAIDRCVERGFGRVRVDVLSTGARKTIAKLSAEQRALLRVVDMGSILDLFPG